ncbi:GNAT family N-acetyltransferase [Thiorhodococcus minor]|uniref:GNAT family N-acetyltransferase n=1 Tax=Thiorhodococcus minor TaxID=57489 RepID=A0A6M0JWU7_9GAMM|nr:GNAT family N-acetyltransferase [Thiorhodococcus minor]NEV61421.1 GNAT family N-acetyltransferase [Thiorhodococcus minor]
MKLVTYHAVEELPETADALFAEADKQSMFLSRPWLENLTQTGLRDGETALFACVVDQDSVLAILPLMTRGGDTWYALKHRYTSLYSLLLTDENRQAILDYLVQGLVASGLDAFLFEPVCENDVGLGALRASMESAGFTCHQSFRFYNWVHSVRGQSYREYMASRPARLRNTIERKKRKLQREQGYEIRLLSGDEVPPAMPHYHAVYSASWKANEQYSDFLDGMVTAFSKSGWSRLAVLSIKGKPAAAQLWLVKHGRASIFRLAYDETWRHYSVGSILTAYLMEQVMDTEQVEEIDFLTGNEAYKQDWMSERRERWALSCVKRQQPIRRFELLSGGIRRVFRRG